MTEARRHYHREWKRRKLGCVPRKTLSHEDLTAIRALLSCGLKQASIARAYEISQQKVSLIARL